MVNKKKRAANLARGFATVSTASKVKVEENQTKTEKPEANVDSPPIGKPEVNGKTDAEPAAKETHQLTPEELEKSLEDNELRTIVDRLSPKVQRDSAKHISRLRTECRVLRGQATPLSVYQAIEISCMLKALHLAWKDIASDSSLSHEPKTGLTKLAEEDTVLKLWTLKSLLQSLGFRQELTRSALEHVLDRPPQVEQSVWGLDEGLDFLILRGSDEEIPEFETSSGRPLVRSANIQNPSEPNDRPKEKHTVAEQEPAAAPESRAESDTTVDEEPVSDLDSDLDPEDALPIYIETKESLYLLGTGAPGRQSSKSRPMKGPDIRSTSIATLSKIKKLQSKLSRIESDILFDKNEAERQWVYRRNQLAQEQAEHRRLIRSKDTADDLEYSPAKLPVEDDQQVESASAEDSSDDGNAIGAMFAAEPLAGQTSSTEASISIRDFGQIKGLTPRRILDEACRARDSGASTSYKLVSRTAFSNRSSVTISWSKDQDVNLPLEAPHVICAIRSPRDFTFTMHTIATPDRQQSEAYIATFALFQIFSTSTKEDKAYLRLPAALRDLWKEFSGEVQSVREARDMNEVKKLRELYQSHVKKVEDKVQNNEEEEVVHISSFRNRASGTGQKSDVHATSKDLSDNISNYAEIWQRKATDPLYQQMLQIRKRLPMYDFRSQTLSMIQDNPVVIICGETGCGKSTQVPAYILESELLLGRNCKIYCTEPRRISATSLAQRVSEELGESKHEFASLKSLVGYSIRLESKVSSATRLIYATTGVVLRMLESPHALQDVTHLVIDEVHERSIETDFLLIIMRKLIIERPGLKLILMSATLEAKSFSAYFHGAPILTVPGRTFPVETKFLEDAIEMTGYKQNDEEPQEGFDEGTDESPAVESSSDDPRQYSQRTRTVVKNFDEYRINYDLILKLLETIQGDERHAEYKKAILVFLPGIAEIRRLQDQIYGTPLSQKNIIHVLHSTISSEEQQQAFELPPAGYGKIILSTNIAETGVTIPDITCVIDSGKHKEMRFDERRQVSKLIESFVSKANATQRRGRAGRVQNGLCYHLFSKPRFDHTMAEQQTPEMLRLPLQELVMRVKICKLGDIQDVLAQALNPPAPKNVRRAIDQLIEIGALTAAEELTSLGLQLSKLPVDPYLGKLVLHGTVFGCLDFALTTAAILTSKSPFVASTGSKKVSTLARDTFKKGGSDLLTDYNAYQTWRRICSDPSSPMTEKQFCRKNSLSSITLCNIEDLKAQLLSNLADAGFLTLSPPQRNTLSRIQNSAHPFARRRVFTNIPEPYDTNNDNLQLISSVIVRSFYPKILVREGKHGWRNVANNQTISLHVTSAARDYLSSNTTQYVTFYSIMQSSSSRHPAALSLHPLPAPTGASSSGVPLALMAGNSAKFQHVANVLNIDGARLRFLFEDTPGHRRKLDAGFVGSWKTMVGVKYIRQRLEQMLDEVWKSGKSGMLLKEMGAPAHLREWTALWREMVENWRMDGKS